MQASWLVPCMHLGLVEERFFSESFCTSGPISAHVQHTGLTRLTRPAAAPRAACPSPENHGASTASPPAFTSRSPARARTPPRAGGARSWCSSSGRIARAPRRRRSRRRSRRRRRRRRCWCATRGASGCMLQSVVDFCFSMSLQSLGNYNEQNLLEQGLQPGYLKAPRLE